MLIIKSVILNHETPCNSSDKEESIYTQSQRQTVLLVTPGYTVRFAIQNIHPALIPPLPMTSFISDIGLLTNCILFDILKYRYFQRRMYLEDRQAH